MTKGINGLPLYEENNNSRRINLSEGKRFVTNKYEFGQREGLSIYHEVDAVKIEGK